MVYNSTLISNNIEWEVTPLKIPKIDKKCSRCKSNEFECSEKFRVNSQQKLSDVWLIYRCAHCDSTWNMAIITRKKLSTISLELFDKFQQNDQRLVKEYAFNKGLLKKNDVTIKPMEIAVIGYGIEDILKSNAKCLYILIKLKYPIDITIKKILKNKLSITSRILVEMVEQKVIILPGNSNDLSLKVTKDFIVQINLEVFGKYFPIVFDRI